MSENEISNDDLIALMRAQEPGDLREGAVVYGGDDDQVEADQRIPPVTVSHVSSAGYVQIYDRRTGESSLTNRNMLHQQVRKVDDKGQLMFSQRPPRDAAGNPIRLKALRHKCWLHGDDPNRAQYDSMGLPVCRKDSLLNEFEVAQHMRKKHKAQYQAITEARERAQREEDRELQRQIVLAATRGVAVRASDPDDIEDDSPRHRGRRAKTAVEA